MKEKTSIRLSAAAREMLRKLAEWMGLSQAGVLETLIRREHKRQESRPREES